MVADSAALHEPFFPVVSDKCKEISADITLDKQLFSDFLLKAR